MSGPSTFCTMGGMTMSSNGRRTLREVKSGHDEMMYTTGYIMPVIISDDGNTGENGDHDMNGMDNEGQSVDHDMGKDMDRNMDTDHSSHGMSMMNSGTIMYMDGFHSALFHSSPQNPPPCLNLFFPSWTLDSPTKFVFAMIFIMLLGVIVEACGVWRVRCLRTSKSIRRQELVKRSQRLQNQRHQNPSEMSQGDHSRRNRVSSVYPAMFRRTYRFVLPQCFRDVLSKKCCNSSDGDRSKLGRRYEMMAASLHAMRVWLGYLLMLAVMSYAIEFLVCTIVGIVLGRYCFVEVERDAGNGTVGSAAIEGGEQASELPENSHIFLGRDGTWGGGDPCCGIDDDDADEYNDDMNADSEVETRSSLLRADSLQGSAVNEPLLASTGPSRRSVI